MKISLLFIVALICINQAHSSQRYNQKFKKAGYTSEMNVFSLPEDINHTSCENLASLVSAGIAPDSNLEQTGMSSISGTITLNNLLVNGSFESWENDQPAGVGSTGGNPGTDYILEKSTDKKAGNYSMKLTSKTAHTTSVIRMPDVPRVKGRLFYIGLWVKSQNKLAEIRLSGGSAGDFAEPLFRPSNETGTWQWVSAILPVPGDAGWFNLRLIREVSSAAGDWILFDGMTIFDLTATFGAGNEPGHYDMELLVKSTGYVDNATPLTITDYSNVMANLRANDTELAARKKRLANNSLKVGSFNMLRSDDYPIMTNAFIESTLVDVIGTQETTDITVSNNLDRRLAGDVIKYTYWDNPEPTMGMGIGSAFPITNTWSAKPDTRGILHATVTFNGQKISVYTLHLIPFKDNDASKSTIQKFWNEIVSRDTSKYIIVTGDFNVPRYKAELSCFDPFLKNGFVSAQGHNGIWHSTYIGSNVHWLDNVLVKGFTVVNTGMEYPANVSDHMMFWAEVQMQKSTPTETKTDTTTAEPSTTDSTSSSSPATTSSGQQVTMRNLFSNGSFESWETSYPIGMINPEPSVTYTKSTDTRIGEYSLKAEANSSGTFNQRFASINNGTTGEIYYVGMWVKVSKKCKGINARGNVVRTMAGPQQTNNWEWCSMVIPADGTYSTYINVQLENRQAGDYYLIDGVHFINLSQAFGLGNEPDKSVIDLILRSKGYIDYATPYTFEYSQSYIDSLKASDVIVQARQKRHANNIIRVGTFNTEADDTNPWIIKQIIDEMDLDLYGNQQCSRPAPGTKHAIYDIDYKFTNLNLSYNHYWARSSTSFGWDGLGMASAFPMINTMASATPSQGYIKTTVVIGGQNVSFYNLHLPAYGTNEEGKAYITGLYNDVIALDPSDYIIVAGDFNYPHVTKDATVWEAFTINGFTSAQGSQHGWKVTFADTPGFIDNVFVKGFTILNTGTLYPSVGSDHNAFWAEIQMITGSADNPAEEQQPLLLANVPADEFLGNKPEYPTCDSQVTATGGCSKTTVVCTPGTITVNGENRSQSFTYTAADDCGNTATDSTIYTWTESINAPVADFAATQNILKQGEIVQIEDLSDNNPVSWSWKFEGGTPQTSSLKNPEVRYYVPGKYSVTLTVTNAGGSDTKSVENYITVEELATGEKLVPEIIFMVKLYPNPVIKNLVMEISDTAGGSYTLYSLNGRKLLTDEIFSERTVIDLSEQLPGAYIMEVKQGSQIFRKTIVKQ